MQVVVVVGGIFVGKVPGTRRSDLEWLSIEPAFEQFVRRRAVHLDGDRIVDLATAQNIAIVRHGAIGRHRQALGLRDEVTSLETDKVGR